MNALSTLSIALLAPMLGIAIGNLMSAPRMRTRPTGSDRQRVVSVLVPARNEAGNLAENLPALLALDYERLEVVVLDDRSVDGTAAVVEGMAAASGRRLRLVRGSDTPAGWLGKNWACHQLAGEATGEVLLFCDADVTPRPAAVLATLDVMERNGASVCTALPRQRLGSWTESAIVPLVTQLPVVGLLPLRLVPLLRSPALSMANGQWLAFTRAAYVACGGHAAVRGEVVEDVALGRRAKAAGERLVVAVAPDVLAVRMYRSAAEVREGFTKNLYPLLGGRPASLVLAASVFGLISVYPWVGTVAGAEGAAVALLLLIAVRACAAVSLRQSVLTILLHPLGSLAALGLAYASYRGSRLGTLTWKGRRLGAARPPPVRRG